MKLYNRGQRVINPHTPFEIRTGKWSEEMPDEEAKKLLKMFPRDLTSNADQVTAEKKEIERLKEELRAANAKNDELLKQVEGLEKLVTEAGKNPTSQLPQDIPAGTTPATVATQQTAPRAPERAPVAPSKNAKR